MNSLKVFSSYEGNGSVIVINDRSYEDLFLLIEFQLTALYLLLFLLTVIVYTVDLSYNMDADFISIGW